MAIDIDEDKKSQEENTVETDKVVADTVDTDSMTDIETSEEPPADIENAEAAADEDLEEFADPLETATSDIEAPSTETADVEEEATDEGGESPSYASPQANKAMQVMNLDSLIKRYLIDIEKLKEQMKTQRDMFEDSFRNDKTYYEESEKVKAANKVKQEVKQKILKQPNVALLADKINSIKDEIKDAESILSGHLQEYMRVSGMNQIVLDDGSILEIKQTTKVVRVGKTR